MHYREEKNCVLTVTSLQMEVDLRCLKDFFAPICTCPGLSAFFDTVVHTIILEKLVTHVLDMVVYKSPGKGD